MKTAFLIDGDFFLRRYRRVYDSNFSFDTGDASIVTKQLFSMCQDHLKHWNRQSGIDRDLYRIFFYDAPPLKKRLHNPISKRAVNLEKSDVAIFRDVLHAELCKTRKVALRLGEVVSKGVTWKIKEHKQDELLKGKIQFSDIQATDIEPNFIQKGVDLRIGLDIASMAYKKQVDQIILVSGDSDFVPAAKLARREGIDFILDPMWHRVSDDLLEHIDGLKSVCPKKAP